MKSGAKVTGALLLAISVPVFGCWQTEQPPVLISAKSLNARITNNDEPLRTIKLELHRAITFNRQEAQSKGAYDTRILKSATSDSNGMLSFGEVAPGKYWLVPSGSRSLGESAPVEVIVADFRKPGRRLWVKYHADGCRDVAVEDLH